MADAITDPISNFPKVSFTKLEDQLNVEYESLKSGYNTAKAKRLDYYKQYRFQPYGNEKSGQSEIVDSTIFNAVEWMTPTLIQPFIETDDFVKVVPEGSDARSIIMSQVHRELLNYQLRKKNPWYQVLYDTAKAFLIQGESYVKITWQKKDISKMEPSGRVKLTAIPASQIRYDWTSQSFTDSRVVTQEEDQSRSNLLKMMSGLPGLMEDKFEAAISSPGRDAKTGALRDEQQGSPNWVGEDNSKMNKDQSLYLRREHWTEYDMNGDGKATPILAVFIDDHLVQVIKNPFPFNCPPFLAAQCVRDPMGNPAFGWAEVLADLQKYKTAIMRMTSDNLNSQQNGLYEVDRMNVDEVGMMLLQNAPQGSRIPIPVRKPGSINSIAPAPIAGHVFPIMEMLEVAAENRSGFTRYSQGLDSKSLNQTATGIVSITQRSEMRMWEIATRFAEMVMKPLARMSIALNQKFLDKQDLEVQFGLPGFPELGIEPKPAGTWITVGKEDIGGYYSVVVDVQTTTDKQQQIDNLLSWGQYFAPHVGQGVPPEAVTLIAAEAAKKMGMPQLEALMRKEMGDGVVGSRGILASTAGAGAGGSVQPGGASPENAGVQEGQGVQGTDLGAVLAEAGVGAGGTDAAMLGAEGTEGF